MKKPFQIILCVIATCFFCACSPKVTLRMVSNSVVEPMTETGRVAVVDTSVALPESSCYLGQVTVTPRYLTTTKKGTLDNELNAAIIKAKSIGGNILKVVFHKAPHGYKAHSIKADIYRTNNPDSVIINKPANHPDHASIWLYRYNFGMDIEYKVFINDDFVYMSSAGTITKVDVYTPGNYTVWAKTEKKVILPLNVELGKDYYIETHVWEGILVPNPLLFLVSDFAGMSAIKNIDVPNNNN